jgi:CRP-like cAMP-binding protein
MTTASLAPILKQHAFFEGLKPEYVDLLIDCASNVRFNGGEFIFHQGEAANRFYLIRHGTVAIEISSPKRKSITLKTLGENEVLGWSWLFPPYQWQFDARALELVRAIALDARCLRGKCDSDPVLGYDLMKRFSNIMLETLQATRLQLLDLYGTPNGR